jgi:trimeric autotransporter adhesin
LNGWRCAALASMAAIILLAGCGSSGPAFNPTPTIGAAIGGTGLFPSNITAGSPAFTLSVFGSGFISGDKGASFVYWNGSARSTTLNQITGELQAQIFASDVATPGPVNVTVINPGPGGGTSNTASFTIEQLANGAPVITSLSPDSANAGGQAFTLTVNGNNFAANDTVTWNGSVRTTTFVNSSQVTASILMDDIADAGPASVAVFPPGLVTGGSQSVIFPVKNGSNNPVPSAGSLSPSSAAHGSGDTQVMVSGSGFTALSSAQWTANMVSTPLALAYLSSSQVVLLIPVEDLLQAGSATIDISNPAPGGGTSKELTFTIN